MLEPAVLEPAMVEELDTVPMLPDEALDDMVDWDDVEDEVPCLELHETTANPATRIAMSRSNNFFTSLVSSEKYGWRAVTRFPS
jgi:hypothetical protein